jgi:glutamine cyclotransferase
MKKFLYISILACVLACNNSGKDKPSKTDEAVGKEGTSVTTSINEPKSISYSVINTFPHDTASFTEGLLFYKGDLYESTGMPGRSRIMKLDLKTGKIVKRVDLEKPLFGEGIVILRDTVYQLTYQDKVGFMYTLPDFKKIGQFTFASPEGWGMTTDGKEIIASDGTSNLSYYQPGTFRLLRTQSVTESGSLSYNLNELEYIDGYIYANQWQAPYILKIDPNSGAIVGKIDFSTICTQIKTKNPAADFFNGIAYDSTTKKMYVTGKQWPELYEIQLSK